MSTETPATLPELLRQFRQRVARALEKWLPPDHIQPARLHEAMRHAVLGGGKRIRAAMVYMTGDAVGADDEARETLRRAENESSYRSAAGLGFDDLIDPRELRNAVLAGLGVSARRRSGPVEPVARIGITP